MNTLIYTDYDVRPDLLTAEERAQFPEVLNNDDRRAILAITRSRMDNVDYDGHPILEPEPWLAAFARYTDGFKEENFIPELRESITREVVLPQTGEVEQVDAGVADMVQRMMDRGIVIDVKNTTSAMITDHPGMRWIYDDNTGERQNKYPAGTHIYANYESERPRIVFQTDNTARYYNDDNNIEAIREAAKLSGFQVMPYENHARAQKALAIELPYLMDGTSYDAYLKEAKHHAESNTTARFTTDRQAWMTQINHSKKYVAESHGGVALYSDNMIQDRISKFERTVQRLMVSDRHLSQRMNDDNELHYANFLTPEQDIYIEKRAEQLLQNIYNERGLPYAYQRYKDSPDRVDEIAQRAGYINYIAYVTAKKSMDKQSNQLWSNFQKLEKEFLTQDTEGMLKLFRIHNGINRDVNRWAQEERRKLAAPVIQSYRMAGYPVDSLKDITLFTDKNGKASVVAEANGKTLTCKIEESVMNRLAINVCTPFEATLESMAKELGWKGRLIIPVSQEAVTHLDLEKIDGTGQCPLRLKYSDRIYKVNEKAWEQGLAIAQYENMPKNIQKMVLNIAPPAKSNLFAYSPDEIAARVEKVRKEIDAAVTGIRALDIKINEVFVKCNIHGIAMSMEKFSLNELKTHKPMPTDNPEIITKQLLAARHLDEVFKQDLSTPKGIGR